MWTELEMIHISLFVGDAVHLKAEAATLVHSTKSKISSDSWQHIIFQANEGGGQQVLALTFDM